MAITPIENNLTITSGDDKNLKLNLSYSDGSDADFSNNDFYFTLKDNKVEYSSDKNAIYQLVNSDMTITTSGTPLITTVLIPYHARDSEGNPLFPKTYYYDVQMVDTNNKVLTWMKGSVTIGWHSTVTTNS